MKCSGICQILINLIVKNSAWDRENDIYQHHSMIIIIYVLKVEGIGKFPKE